MKSLNYLVFLIGVGVLSYWLLPDRPSAKSASADTVPKVFYLCEETEELVKAPLQQVPATNPQTGRKTLYRALYCSDCEKWRAVPPPEVYPGNPLAYRCPKHDCPMAVSGPNDEKN